MIVYLCMKYESNTLMYSIDIAWNPFLSIQDGTYVHTYYMPPIKNGEAYKTIIMCVCGDKGPVMQKK